MSHAYSTVFWEDEILSITDWTMIIMIKVIIIIIIIIIIITIITTITIIIMIVNNYSMSACWI